MNDLNKTQRENFAESFDTLAAAEDHTRQQAGPRAELRQQGIEIEYCGGLLDSYAIVIDDATEDEEPNLWRWGSVWVKTRQGRKVARHQRSPMLRAIAALDEEPSR